MCDLIVSGMSPIFVARSLSSLFWRGGDLDGPRRRRCRLPDLCGDGRSGIPAGARARRVGRRADTPPRPPRLASAHTPRARGEGRGPLRSLVIIPPLQRAGHRRAARRGTASVGAMHSGELGPTMVGPWRSVGASGRRAWIDSPTGTRPSGHRKGKTLRGDEACRSDTIFLGLMAHPWMSRTVRCKTGIFRVVHFYPARKCDTLTRLWISSTFGMLCMVGEDAYTGCRVPHNGRATTRKWQTRRGEQLTPLAESLARAATSTTRNTRRDRSALTTIVWRRDTALHLYVCVPPYLRWSDYFQHDLSSCGRFPSPLGAASLPRRPTASLSRQAAPSVTGPRQALSDLAVGPRLIPPPAASSGDPRRVPTCGPCASL